MARQLFIVFFVLLSSIQFEMYASIKIEITPNTFNEEKDTDGVKVVCTMDAKESSATEITKLKIGRKGARSLVILHPNNTIQFDSANKEEESATGTIESGVNIMKSYLEMVIKEPEKEDAGHYICHVQYKTELGATLHNKIRAKLIVHDARVNSVNSKVAQLLEKLEKEKQKRREVNDHEKKDGSNVSQLEVEAKKREALLQDLLKKEDTVKSKVTELEEKTEKQLLKIKELSDKEDIEVKSLKSTMKAIIDKVKKEEQEIMTVGEKETSDGVKVNDLEEKIEQQTKQLTDLAGKEKKVEKKIGEWQQTATTQVKKFQDLMKTGVKDVTKVSDLVDETVKQSQMLHDLSDADDEIETKMMELDEKVESALKKINHIKWAGESDDGMTDTATTTTVTSITPSIAFAANNQREYIRIQEMKEVVFPNMIMQTGPGYNPTTGVFTAPLGGIYYFTLVVKTECKRCYATLALKVNENIVCRLIVGVIYDQNQASAGTTVVAKKDDEISVVVEKATKNTVFTPGRLTVFSGYLSTITDDVISY